MERLDTSPSEGYFSCAIYGKSGSGKTNFGVTAPKPLILLGERQGMLHIRQASVRLGRPMPPVLGMTCLQDYRNVLRALYGSKEQPFRVFEVTEGPEKGQRQRELLLELPEWPETVVLDSVTELARFIVEEIREQSPPKMGKDGLPVDSERFWGALSDRAIGVVKGFRDAPLNRIFLALADDRMVGEEGDQRRQLTLDLPMRKLPEIVTATVNCVGYAYRRELREPVKDQPGKTRARTVYGIMTSGPEYMAVKPCRPLRDVEVPDFTHWLAVIKGSVAATFVSSPAPSQESLLATIDSAEDEQVVQVAGAVADELTPQAIAKVAGAVADELTQLTQQAIAKVAEHEAHTGAAQAAEAEQAKLDAAAPKPPARERKASSKGRSRPEAS